MLKKDLIHKDVFYIAARAMIFSGLFLLPGIAFGSYALAVLFMIPTMLSELELSTVIPKSGEKYFSADRSLGPLVGIMAGLGN